eukprot:TRINITY_DN16918_c0_g1_i1.p1 TRINITY_DN16918_c0_g1~~TRINITY_DN16918_c0_g1_i1.p1  ORF type:complete len:976 (-),score=290.53 TRINITY_DN16918_c0_g1_i1:195-3122(-)
MLEISVPSSQKSMQTVTYNIEIRDGNSLTKAAHRYSEFEALHKNLIKQFGETRVISLPGKKIFGNMNSTYVEERREALEVYLKAICADANILLQSEDLWEFLEAVPAEVKVEKFVTKTTSNSEDPKIEIADVAELSEDPESWPLLTTKACLEALVKLASSIWVKGEDCYAPNITVQEPLCRTMVNLCVEPANRQSLIEAGGFTGCLHLLSHVNPEEQRVVKGVVHVICTMARAETVRGILVSGGMKALSSFITDSPSEQLSSAMAMFCWRASCSHEGRSGLIAAGGLQLLMKMIKFEAFTVKVLVYLVATALVDELTQSTLPAEWTTMMAAIEPFLRETEHQAASSLNGPHDLARLLAADLSVPIDIERLAAMAATSTLHAQLISTWVLSLFATDSDELRSRVRQGGGQSALASALRAEHPLTQKFAARALLDLFPGGSVQNSVQEMGLRLGMAKVLMEESKEKDADLAASSEALNNQLAELAPTIQERGQEPQLNKDALHNVIIAVGNIVEMRTSMVTSHQESSTVANTFQGSTSDSAMRTQILNDEVSNLDISLQEVQKLCSENLAVVGNLTDDHPEDETASLIAAREELKKQVKQAGAALEMHQDSVKDLKGKIIASDKQVQQCQLALSDAPVRKNQLNTLLATIEASSAELATKMKEADDELTAIEEGMKKAEAMKKKIVKKDTRVTSLVETLATMIEMEDESKKKAEELSAMGEQMKSMMEEMAKRQKMMQTMMTQVMAGIGGLNGEDDEEDDNLDGGNDATQTVQEKEEQQRKNILMLQDRVNSLLGEVKSAMTENTAEIATLQSNANDIQVRKTAMQRELDANGKQVFQAQKELENLANPEAIEKTKAEAEALNQQQNADCIEAQKLAAEAHRTQEDWRVKLENHQQSMEKLEAMQKSGNDLCQSWESKMRKHITKRKKLFAQSSTFDETVGDINTKIGEEKDQWTEVLKPLIADAIAELTKLHEQLE